MSIGPLVMRVYEKKKDFSECCSDNDEVTVFQKLIRMTAPMIYTNVVSNIAFKNTALHTYTKRSRKVRWFFQTSAMKLKTIKDHLPPSSSCSLTRRAPVPIFGP